jgi:two-component system, NtrC family, sensor kinase
MTDTTEFERYFKVIRDIHRAVHTRNSVREILEVVVAKSCDILSAKGALIRILNKDTHQFEVRAACGMGEKYLSKGPVSTEKLIADPDDLHKVILIRDIWNAPRVEYPQNAWNEGIRMILDVPLAVENNLVGLIRIYLQEVREFSDSELDFIVTIAEQCACIIERVQLQEKQQAHFTHIAAHVDKLSSLGRMAAGVAHEINNPLAGILLFSSNMSKKVPAEGPLQNGLQVIIRETQRCKTIIQGLLDFARDSQPQKTETDLNVIMRNAIAVVENEFLLKHVHLDTQFSAHMIKTLLDENQILQVFINILLNALQATGKDGRVKVQSQVGHSHQTVGMSISDDGCGIAADVLEKIFEPFFSTKSQGTGLGLAVSYGIVKNHQGTIKAYSEPGRGTLFVVEFPIRADMPIEKELDESHAYSSN